MPKSSQVVTQKSHVDNRGATYANRGDVYNAPVTSQTIVHDGSKTYKVNHENIEGIEFLSIFVMKHLGERNALISGLIAIVMGAGQVASATYRFPALVERYATPLFASGFVCLLIGATLVYLRRYKYDSRCMKCNKFYAMKEVGTPVVRETPVRDGTRYETTRTYGCRYCGEKVTQASSRFEADED